MPYMMQCLEVEADEMASFVKKKANKQWIWIAMDATSRGSAIQVMLAGNGGFATH